MNQATQTALDYARAGWYVFPIIPGQKVPYKGFNWRELSTNDPDIVLQAADHPDYAGCNWAVDCGKSQLFVLDVDLKKDKKGKNGWDSLMQFPEEIDRSFEVKTPSGGRHYYMAGQGPNSASKMLGPGLDTRGEGGYVLIPGSTNGTGEPYALLSANTPKPIPDWLQARFTKKRIQSNEPIDVDLDTTSDVDRAIIYLKHHAPEAVEGDGGDETTYKVACRVKDLGVSIERAWPLMLEHWNDTKAFPPWDPGELYTKVKNAYGYSQNPTGIMSTEAMFQADLHAPPNQATGDLLNCKELNDNVIERKNWILGTRYLPGLVTLTIAPGGVGKSMLTILEALSIVTGRQLTYDEPIIRGPVWIYNAEDHLDELKRRVWAAAKHHGITADEMDGLYISSGAMTPIKLVEADNFGKAYYNINSIEDVVQKCIERNILVFFADPFVRSHSVSENDNRAIDMVTQAFGLIGQKAGCAIGINHHTAKGVKDAVGNADKSRGASSLVFAARVASTLYPMSEQDGRDYLVSSDLVPWIIRMDHAKANMAEPGAGVRWFKKVSVKLKESDGIQKAEKTGTLEMYPLDKVQKVYEDNDSIATALMTLMPENGGTVTLYSLAKRLNKEAKVGMSEKSIVRKAVREWFIFPRVWQGWEYRLTRVKGKNSETDGLEKIKTEEVK